MNMNPNLMQFIEKIEMGGGILDDEQKKFIETIKALDESDLKDPTQWPWRDKTNGYIKTLRKLVGHFPIVLSVATAVVLDDSMRILLERRSDDGKWSIPGGTVGPGESVKECIVGDISRETSLDAEIEDLHLFDELSGTPHYYPNGDIISSIKIIYVAKHCTGELKPNYENLELEYFDLQDIPENVSGTTRKIVASLISRFDEVKNW